MGHFQCYNSVTLFNSDLPLGNHSFVVNKRFTSCLDVSNQLCVCKCIALFDIDILRLNLCAEFQTHLISFCVLSLTFWEYSFSFSERPKNICGMKQVAMVRFKSKYFFLSIISVYTVQQCVLSISLKLFFFVRFSNVKTPSNEYRSIYGWGVNFVTDRFEFWFDVPTGCWHISNVFFGLLSCSCALLFTRFKC